jgi:hypothetical protein
MNIDAYYKRINEITASIQQSSFSDADTCAAFCTSQAYLIDFNVFYEILANRHEAPLFQLAFKEYEFSLIALSSGHYRHAYIGLRLFFEMMLAGILFSSNEVHYRLWTRNEKDIVWGELINEDKGVFSRNFCLSFNEDLKDHMTAFKVISEQLYRECSEYVHGNLHTHNNLPKNLEFEKKICLEWHIKAKTMYLVILFLFSVRYLKYLHEINDKKFMINKSKVESIILNELGYMPEIRALM